MKRSMSTKVTQARSRLATLSRRSMAATTDQIEEARRALAEAKIVEYVEKVVASAPPLSDEQRNRIAALIRAGETA